MTAQPQAVRLERPHHAAQCSQQGGHRHHIGHRLSLLSLFLLGAYILPRRPAAVNKQFPQFPPPQNAAVLSKVFVYFLKFEFFIFSVYFSYIFFKKYDFKLFYLRHSVFAWKHVFKNAVKMTVFSEIAPDFEK